MLPPPAVKKPFDYIAFCEKDADRGKRNILYFELSTNKDIYTDLKIQEASLDAFTKAATFWHFLAVESYPERREIVLFDAYEYLKDETKKVNDVVVSFFSAKREEYAEVIPNYFPMRKYKVGFLDIDERKRFLQHVADCDSSAESFHKSCSEFFKMAFSVPKKDEGLEEKALILQKEGNELQGTYSRLKYQKPFWIEEDFNKIKFLLPTYLVKGEKRIFDCHHM